MAKRNRIILLIDFSENTENLIQFAADLSGKIRAKLIFVHQLGGSLPAMSDAESRQEMHAMEREEAWRKLRSFTQDHAFNEEDFIISKKGIPVILEELKNQHYSDWVLSGLKKAGAFKKLLVGSTTLKVVEQSGIINVAVPVKNRVPIPEKLVVALNYKFPANHRQLQLLFTSLADQVKEIEFISVVTDTDDAQQTEDHLKELETKYNQYPVSSRVFRGENAFSAIKERMNASGNSFLVLQQGSRSLKNKLFRKFMINELVHEGNTPLIIIPQRAEDEE